MKNIDEKITQALASVPEPDGAINTLIISAAEKETVNAVKKHPFVPRFMAGLAAAALLLVGADYFSNGAIASAADELIQRITTKYNKPVVENTSTPGEDSLYMPDTVIETVVDKNEDSWELGYTPRLGTMVFKLDFGMVNLKTNKIMDKSFSYDDKVQYVRSTLYPIIYDLVVCDEVPLSAVNALIDDITEKTEYDFMRDGFTFIREDLNSGERKLFYHCKVEGTENGWAWFVLNESEVKKLFDDEAKIQTASLTKSSDLGLEYTAVLNIEKKKSKIRDLYTIS